MDPRRVAAAAAVVVVLGLTLPAQAHEEHALDVLTVIDRVSPAVDGVEIRIVHMDSPALVVTNETKETVTVLGERGEPFLEIGPEGVRANVESPTTYHSAAPRRDVAPADLKPEGPPEWARFSEEPSWTWFDPRLRVGPGREAWEVPLIVGGRPVTIEGGYEPLEGHGHFETTMEPPAIEGLDLRLTQGLIPAVYARNDTGVLLEVAGEAGEPFLEIGPEGVRANLRSPTYYTSGSTSIQKVPPTADAAAKPQWSKVSPVPVWAWLERRAAVPSELYQRAVLGSERRTVLEWTSDYTLGGEPLAVQGRVDWVPPAESEVGSTQDGPPWRLIAAATVVGAAAAAAFVLRRSRMVR